MASNQVAEADSVTDQDDVDLSILKNYKVHEAAAMFPMLSAKELKELAADIKERNQRDPIWTYRGQILDGRNRLVACAHAGVMPKFEEWSPQKADDTPTAFVMSKNIHRRHLSASVRAAIAVNIEKVIAEDNRRLREEHRKAKAATPFSHREAATDSPVAASSAAARQVAFASPTDKKQAAPAVQKQRPGSPFGVPSAAPTPAAAPAPARLTTGRARDLAAEALSVSTGYLNDAKDLANSYPDEFEQVLSGAKTLPRAQEDIVVAAKAAGALESVKLRPGAVRTVLHRSEAKQYKKDRPKKEPIRIRKFTKVESSRIAVTLNITFGNPSLAESLLNEWQNDPRILELTYEIKD